MHASGPLFLIFLLRFVSAQKTTADHPCPSPCRGSDLSVQFPFGLTGSRCGYPGFDLSCNRQRQTILNLPPSGGFVVQNSFVVQNIDYATQSVWLNDAGNCLPSRLLNFTLEGSPFSALRTKKYTLVNCSGDTAPAAMEAMPMMLVIRCMSGEDYRVMSVESQFYLGPRSHGCRELSTVSVPVAWPAASDLHEDLMLVWREPDCRSCLARGGTCGLRDGPGSEIACTNVPSTGLPRSAKYGIIIGLGIPAVLCLIGLAGYVWGLISNYSRRCRHRHRQEETNTEFPTIIFPQSFVMTGLDGPTIESYPKTLLGVSRRLPKPSDNTCPICLCEYQPEEALRTIPECNHYFHADCIDEWLKRNATCPLCRNSPEGSVLFTPSFTPSVVSRASSSSSPSTSA